MRTPVRAAEALKAAMTFVIIVGNATLTVMA
jgi:hypothetical protein